jgi:DNA repair protein RecO (recombination protein O)
VPRPRVHLTEAVILRQRDYAEADRLLTLLTPAGKVVVLARGVRRPTSRKSGHLGLFCRSRLMLATGSNMDLVTQAEVIEAHEALGRDLLRYAYASYVAELVDLLVPEGEGSPQLFELVSGALAWFATASDLRLEARRVELALLNDAGYMPSLYKCVVCGNELVPERNVFDVAQGGLVCASCSATLTHGVPLSLGAQKVLRYLGTRSPDQVALLRIRDSTHQELERVMQAYLQYTLERQLKSTEFLKALRANLLLHEGASLHDDAEDQAQV